MPLEILLSVGRFDPAQLEFDANELSETHDCDGHQCTHEHHHANHTKTFSTWSYETDEAISLDALREMVERRLPGSIYRCKGVIYGWDQPRRRAILQCVRRRTDVTVGDHWDDRSPKTQIVAIGVPGMMDPKELETLFDSCIADRQEEGVETHKGVHTVRI